jgi:ABC-type lipoprotein release transport system permease subunit
MTYRRALVFRWSRRDWLAVLTIAVTVAFFVGVALLVVAMGAQTATLAGDKGTTGSATYYNNTDLSPESAPDEAVVISVARVETSNSTAYVAGVPVDARDNRFGERQLAPGDGPTLGTASNSRTDTLVGTGTRREVTVSSRNGGVLPPSWYVTTPTTVAKLGQTGTLVIDPGESGEVPLRGILVFFEQGTTEVLNTVTATAGGAAVLLAVIVFSVTRMIVRDRRTAIRVARSTGATPRGILALFVGRATLLSVAGIVLGGALAIIVTNAAVNAAIVAGLPTTVSINPGAAVGLVGPLLAAMIVVGGLAGGLAAWRTVRQPPAILTQGDGRTGATHLNTRLLGGRTVVPVAATLAVFVAFAALIAGFGLTVAPLVTADETTITQPGSPHLAASSVPAAHAEALDEAGVNASAEILLFSIVEGRPVVARGANFEAFVSVSDAGLVDGRAPVTADEAVIGQGLAQTLGVDVGESLVISGSTDSGVARLDIIGIYSAPGAVADQLVVPLPTARHLSGTGEGRAQFIRTRGLTAASGNPAGGAGTDGDVNTTGVGAADFEDGVVDIEAPATVQANSSFEVTVTLRNDALTERTLTTEVTYRDQTERVETSVSGEGSARAVLSFEAGPPGDATIAADDVKQSVAVTDPDALLVESLPEQVPPGAAPSILVLDSAGTPVEGAMVTVDDEPVTADGSPRRTDVNGSVRVPFEATGTRTVTVRDGSRSATNSVQVTTEASRQLDVEISIEPASPTPTTRPVVELRLSNPWAEPLMRRYVIDAPGGPYEQTVTVGRGKTRVIERRLPRRSGSTYEVDVSTKGASIAAATYTVRGDDRIVSALASAGVDQEPALSSAVEVAFGNLHLLLGALGLLAGLMTVGGTIAALASAVQARRRTVGIHRATGATKWRVLRIVLGDTIRIGTVAMALALGAGLAGLAAVAAVGYLTAFGVQVPILRPWWVAAGIVSGMAVVLVLSAGLATAALLARSPSGLLRDHTEESP